MNKFFLYSTIIVFLTSCNHFGEQPLKNQNKEELLRYVDAFIGTSGAGNTYPGAVLPNGMVSASPVNTFGKPRKNPTQKGTYVFGEPEIYGFGQVHYSGVGCKIGGNIVLAPFTGEKLLKPSEIKSAYSQESASPGYYSVFLDKPKINIETTVTERAAIYKFSLPEGSTHILLNLSHPVNHVKGGYLNMVSPYEIEGYEIDGGFCGSPFDHKIFFVVKFSKASSEQIIVENGIAIPDVLEYNSPDLNCIYSFESEKSDSLYVKVGISFSSIKNARMNLEAEIPEYNFEKIREEASNQWHEKLSKIQVSGGTDKEKTMFYTALYHSLILPSLFSDVNHDAPAFHTSQSRILPFSERTDTIGEKHNHQVVNTGRKRYNALSLWDTYRTVHPLFTLAYPDIQSDIVASMVSMYEESGALPLWPVSGYESGAMVGDPAVIVISDTYRKGIKNFDTTKAMNAMLANSLAPSEGGNNFRRGHEEYIKFGFIPEDLKKKTGVWGSVSTALEYGLADASLSKFLKEFANADNSLLGYSKKFHQRSKTYQHYWDDETGFLRPKDSDGNFVQPFDPKSTEGEIPGFGHLGGIGFVEGNAWQYLFFVPHDIPGLIDLMGGEQIFIHKLEQCFHEDQFVLWNEPDMNYPFLFNYVTDEEYRTQIKVKQLINKYFNEHSDGLPGNDDAGTISAWLVFAMMGIYPDAPGFSANYQVFNPTFKKVTINLDSNYYQGKTFTIKTSGNAEGQFINNLSLNGNKINRYYLNHHEITNGGELQFQLSPLTDR